LRSDALTIGFRDRGPKGQPRVALHRKASGGPVLRSNRSKVALLSKEGKNTAQSPPFRGASRSDFTRAASRADG